MSVQFPIIYPVTCHTNHVGAGSTFVAIRGMQLCGLDYIPYALDRGATTVVCEYNAILAPDVQERIEKEHISLVRVPNARLALAQLSAQAAGYPADKLKILAITGTKGKTTSAFLLEHIVRTAGYKTALLGTVRNSIHDTTFATGLTTQQPDYLHQFFSLCVQEKVDYVIMEVAAQALSLHRVHGLEFDGIIFTNFSQEHAEFYPTMQEYFEAKCEIFKHAKKFENGQVAPIVVNGDDYWCQKISANYKDFIWFGLENKNNQIVAEVSTLINNGILFDVVVEGARYAIACPSLVGAFNIYNLTGVIGLACSTGIGMTSILQACKTFTRVPGRMERYALPNGAQCIIDYAHNPSSYEGVLSTLRRLTQHLIVVFGCGGDRDATKRPIMGSIAAKYADLVVLTSDNPRSENPLAIINAIKAGIGSAYHNKVVLYQDRKEAIVYAYTQSKSGSLIALLGKGPDEYQIVGNVKTYFSEASIIRELSFTNAHAHSKIEGY